MQDVGAYLQHAKRNLVHFFETANRGVMIMTPLLESAAWPR